MEILIRAPKELKQVIQNEARRRGIPMNALILQILWDYADRRNIEALRGDQVPYCTTIHE